MKPSYRSDYFPTPDKSETVRMMMQNGSEMIDFEEAKERLLQDQEYLGERFKGMVARLRERN